MGFRRRHPARRGLGALVTLVLAVTTPMVWAGEAAAATGTQSFTIVYTGDPRAGAVATVAAQGVINAAGTARSLGVEFLPGGDSVGITLIALPRGTVTARALNIVAPFVVDPRSCVGTFAVSGPVTFGDGTGSYAGASGGGTYSARGWAPLARTSSGCSETPRGFYAIIRVTGTLSVPGL